MRPGRDADEIVIAVIIDLVRVVIVAEREGSDGAADNESGQAPARIAGAVEAGNTELLGRFRGLVDGVLLPFVERPPEPSFNDEGRAHAVRVVRDQTVVIAFSDVATGVIEGPVGWNIQNRIALLARVAREEPAGVVDYIIGTDCSEVLIDGIDLRGEEVVVLSGLRGQRKLRKHALQNGGEPVGRYDVSCEEGSADPAGASGEGIVNRMTGKLAAEIAASKRLRRHCGEDVGRGADADGIEVAEQEKLVLLDRAAQGAAELIPDEVARPPRFGERIAPEQGVNAIEFMGAAVHVVCARFRGEV